MSDQESIGCRMISEERWRQINEEGFTADHDSQWWEDALPRAALCYLQAALHEIGDVPQDSPPFVPDWTVWPFARAWWKPTPDDPVRMLVKAGALVAAAIDYYHAKT